MKQTCLNSLWSDMRNMCSQYLNHIGIFIIAIASISCTCIFNADSPQSTRVGGGNFSCDCNITEVPVGESIYCPRVPHAAKNVQGSRGSIFKY